MIKSIPQLCVILFVEFSRILPLAADMDQVVSVEEYCAQLGPVDEERQKIQTINNYGSHYCFNTELTESFLKFCREKHKPLNVLEIGSAFGIKSSQIVQTGAFLACNDIEPRHLEVIQTIFQSLTGKNTQFSHVAFYPGNYLDLSLKNLGGRRFDGILIESVLHFLSPDETVRMIAKLYDELLPGGRVFIMVSSPFLRYLYDAYERNKEHGEEWPGFFPDPEKIHAGNNRLRKPYHTFDKETLGNALIQAGFTLCEARYIPLPHHEYDMSVDGREGLMIIAEKPLF